MVYLVSVYYGRHDRIISFSEKRDTHTGVNMYFLEVSVYGFGLWLKLLNKYKEHVICITSAARQMTSKCKTWFHYYELITVSSVEIHREAYHLTYSSILADSRHTAEFQHVSPPVALAYQFIRNSNIQKYH